MILANSINSRETFAQQVENRKGVLQLREARVLKSHTFPKKACRLHRQ